MKASASYSPRSQDVPNWGGQVVYAGTRTGQDSLSESLDSAQMNPDDSVPIVPVVASENQVQQVPFKTALSQEIDIYPGFASEFRGPGLAPVSAYQREQVMVFFCVICGRLSCSYWLNLYTMPAEFEGF